jgi:hypothetical protein
LQSQLLNLNRQNQERHNQDNQGKHQVVEQQHQAVLAEVARFRLNTQNETF